MEAESLDLRFKNEKNIKKESRKDLWKFIRCAVEQNCKTSRMMQMNKVGRVSVKMQSQSHHKRNQD